MCYVIFGLGGVCLGLSGFDELFLRTEQKVHY